MIEVLMELADIGSVVTIVVTKKDENYLISITPKTPSQNLQPVLISGSKADILADFHVILKGMGELKRNLSNLETINQNLEKKVTEKVNAPATESKTADKTAKKKGPIKVGSGTTTGANASADLFGQSESKTETTSSATKDEIEIEEIQEIEADDNIPENPIADVQTEAPVKESVSATNQPAEEEEEIF